MFSVRTMEKQQGFTLLEAIFTLVIAALIVTMGVPSFTSTIKNNRLVTETNRLVGAIQLARSEAVKRGQVVSICRSGDGLQCGGGGVGDKVYDRGWLVYADIDGANDDYHVAKDTLIKVGDPSPTNITINSNAAGNNWLSFSPIGILDKNNQIAWYVVCDKTGSTEAVPGRSIRIDITGLPKTSKLSAGASCTP